MRHQAAAPTIVWPGANESFRLPAGQTGATSDAEAPAAEERIREAHQAGYREGLAAGREEAQAGARAEAQTETRPAMERLARTLEELAALKPRLREEAESDLVRLAVAIARRIVRRELTIDPQAIEGLIRVALRELEGREVSRVRVHPEHAQLVRGLVAGAGRENAIEVVGDPSMERGGAVFETARGNLDASVDSQLAEIERGLTDRFRRSA